MPLQKWKKRSETILLKNTWWTHKKDETELPSGKRGEYHYVHTNGASMVVAVLENNRVVFVNQYRYLNNRESLELPCGGVKDEHSYEETAMHELEEEAGFIASSWQLVGEFNPYNGITDEICRVFIAKNLKEVPSKPDDTEEFEKIFLMPDEVDARIAAGSIWDGMTIAAWNIAKSRIL
jgi:8-oxo-dGTP pyrophosphatase MutT (NUDIX family)